MLALIILLVFGIGVSVFALQNTILTTVTLLGNTIPNVPLYTVILGSMLFGVIAASIIGFIDSLGKSFILSRKNREIAAASNDVTTLQKRVTELEEENALLKQDKKEIIVEKNAELDKKDAEITTRKPSLLENLRQSVR